MTMSPVAVLELPLTQPNDAEAWTIRDYLGKLLLLVWEEGEGFDGKRPFGNGGWEDDLMVPLIKFGVIEGRIDEDGFPEDYDEDAGQKVIARAIKVLAA